MFAFAVFGVLTSGGTIDNPADFELDGWTDGHDGRLLRSMLAGVENMA